MIKKEKSLQCWHEKSKEYLYEIGEKQISLNLTCIPLEKITRNLV